MRPDPIDRRVMRALALSREPGFNQPGHFLEMSFDRVGEARALASIDTGPHCADVDGQMNLGALALLADIALASSLRSVVGKSARVATVSMSLQLTGEPRAGRIEADAAFDGFVAGAAERQGLARASLHAGGKLVAAASGAFMVIGRPDATAPHPLPKRGEMLAAALAEADLTEGEAKVLALARKARAAADAEASFLDRFWGYRPRRLKSGATCRTWNGPHIGNRVGHTQGGVSFGLACRTAMAALPASWRLVGASAWYVGPGIGATLATRSRILHRGLSTAVVHSTISDGERNVLEAVTSHAR